MRCLVTTSASGDADEARALAERFGLRDEPRAGRTIAALLRASAGAPVLVLGEREADLHQGERRWRASAGIALLRMKRVEGGEVDPLVRAGGLRAGDAILDCTLGLGGDALVAAQAAGPSGQVVGVESSPVLAAFTCAGLRRLLPPASEAAARIEVRCADHRALLPSLAAGSFDVVLFDPMFRAPKDAASSFEPLRVHGEHALLEPAHLEEARRVARRGVLVKDAWPGRELFRLGLVPLPSRRLPRIVFGWSPAAAA